VNVAPHGWFIATGSLLSVDKQSITTANSIFVKRPVLDELR
jgi:hypothetical protein